MEGMNEETRKRSGDCLNQANSSEDTLPPNLVEICKPYHCGVCNEPLRSQLISTAHYAGTPHANNVKWELEIIKNGGKQPSKRKRDEIFLGKIIKPKEVNSFPCDVCNINLIGEETFKSHIFGSQHKNKLQSVKNLENPKRFYCDVCDIDLRMENQFKAHQIGKTHKKKLKSMQSFYCDVCHVSAPSADLLNVHLVGKIHKKKLKQLQIENLDSSTSNLIKSGPIRPSVKIESNKSHSCDVCNITVTSDENLKAHILGKAHKKKLQKIESGQIAAKSTIDSLKSEPIVSNQSDQICTAIIASATPSPVSTIASTNASVADSKVNNAFMGKDVVMTLNEFAVKNGYQLEWKLVSETGHPLPKAFTFQLKAGEHISQGTGSNKKFAKKAAAEQMMNILSKEWKQAGNNKVVKKTSATKKKKSKKSSTKKKTFFLSSNEPTSSIVLQKVATMDDDSREMSVIKDEEMENCEAKDIPELSDAIISNLPGPSDIIKNKTIKVTVKLKGTDSLHPAKIDEKPSGEISEREDIVFLTKNHELNKPALEDEDAASSDDDLIILENPDNLSSQKFLENTQNPNNTPVVESVKLCVYPLGQSESVTVSTQDYATLAYDTYLNDIIIDFYLLYLSNNVLSNSDREKVHIFSTMFYKRLMQPPGANAKKVPEYENDETLTPSEIRHFRVASWTKSVDLFEKDMIIIPICEESHWYLLLVVKPGVIFLPLKTKERKEKGEPFMIVLDSVGGRKNTAVKNIRRYLACEWNKKKCEGAENLTDLEQMGKLIDTVRPHKPEQQNNSDCGIFLLQYVDKVFQNVSAFLWPFLVNSRTREWFTSEEVGSKRGEIAQLIKRLTAEQRPGEFIQYPEIQFVKTEKE